MKNLARILALATVAAPAAACASRTPPADRIVYEASAPVATWREHPAAPARDDVPESVRRAWLDRVNPAPAPLPERQPVERVVVREQVRYVGRDDCRSYVPPVSLNLGWSNWGRRHHHFGWGLGWSVPLWDVCR